MMMIKNYLLLIGSLFANSFSIAQDCSSEKLAQLPGKWNAGPQGSINNVTSANLAKEKAVLANIHKMLLQNYKPTGSEISYSTVFGKYNGEGQVWVADPYYYSMYILRYLCEPDEKKHYVDHSTPTTVSISANAIYSLNTLYASNLPSDDFRGYLKMKQRPEKKDGYYFLGEEVVGNSHLPNKIKEYRWLITYNDTLPFSYVSRREYLLIQKKRLEKSIKESPSEKNYLDQFVNNVNEYLKKPEEELSKPAICMWNDEERFTGFVEEGSRGSFIAVKPNAAYYHKNLPLSSPQFFTVVYKISHGDPVFEENIANIKKAIDFGTLRGMLGK